MVIVIIPREQEEWVQSQVSLLLVSKPLEASVLMNKCL